MPRLSPPRSKRVTLPDDPPEATDLPTEEVVIELSEDDLDGLTIETAPQDPVEPKEPEPEPDEAVRRAVEAQQRAEEIARTAQRERDDAVRREREREGELVRERGDREDAQYNGVLTAIAAEQATLERAEAEYAAALQAGEYTAAAKANAVISKATARIDRLEDNKSTFDEKRASKTTEPAQRQAPPQRPATVDQQIDSMPVPDNAKTWLRSHPELVTDPSQNNKLGAAHRYLTEIKGLTQFNQAYFDALETELGIKKPAAAPASEPQPQQRRSMPVSAPVTRDVPTTSGQRQTPSQITLSPEEVQIARSAYTDPTGKMTNADKERAYALNKIKLQKMRSNGEYPSRERA